MPPSKSAGMQGTSFRFDFLGPREVRQKRANERGLFVMIGMIAQGPVARFDIDLRQRSARRESHHHVVMSRTRVHSSSPILASLVPVTACPTYPTEERSSPGTGLSFLDSSRGVG